MSNLEMLLIAAGLILGVCGIYKFVLPYLKQKKIDSVEVTNKVKEGLEEGQTVIKAVEAIDPSNEALKIFDIIDNCALRATKAAQQMAISGQLSVDKRKETAKDSILAGLQVAKIPVDENLGKVIDDAIEEFVIDSKTHEEQKNQQQNTLQKQNEALQGTINQLTNDKTALQNQVKDLTSKLNNVKATLVPDELVAQNTQN